MARPVFKAGDLRSVVTVQRRSETPDGYGNTLSAWGTIGSGIPAQVSPIRGGEQVRQQRLAGVDQYEIVVRSDGFTRSIKVSDRLLNERTGQTYDVKSALNLDERDQWLVLSAVAIV